MEIEAEYYEPEDGSLRCKLCPKNCLINEGKLGFCGVRKNVSGKLLLLNHSRPCSMHVDPIEKKPLNHFYPGKPVFSISTAGCNLSCKHCQNYEIARGKPGDFSEPEVAPETVVELAVIKGCDMIAYTYTEPTIFFEYMRDIAKIAKKRGLKNVIVSNGYINPEPLKELMKYIDAANIDLKALDDDFYQKVCSAKLQPVLDTIKTLHKSDVWLEITNLIIPTMNDKPEQIQKLIDWVADNIGPDVPLHFSRFHPYYKMSDLNPTPPSTLDMAYELAKKKLHYVYIGNLRSQGEHTYCHSCGALILSRGGFGIMDMKIKEGGCSECGVKIPGRWR